MKLKIMLGVGYLDLFLKEKQECFRSTNVKKQNADFGGNRKLSKERNYDFDPGSKIN